MYRGQQRRLPLWICRRPGLIDAALDRLFTVDRLSEPVVGQRYLVGDTITETDVRLFTTRPIRPVYHGHFQVQPVDAERDAGAVGVRPRPVQTSGFGDTVDFSQIKRHYYVVHRDINPTGMVPKGPDLSHWLTRTIVNSSADGPFGDGTPPPPPRSAEIVPRTGWDPTTA